MELTPLVMPEPCSKMYEHFPHVIMIIPMHNLGYPKMLTCQGWKKPE